MHRRSWLAADSAREPVVIPILELGLNVRIKFLEQFPFNLEIRNRCLMSCRQSFWMTTSVDVVDLTEIFTCNCVCTTWTSLLLTLIQRICRILFCHRKICQSIHRSVDRRMLNMTCVRTSIFSPIFLTVEHPDRQPFRPVDSAESECKINENEF